MSNIKKTLKRITVNSKIKLIAWFCRKLADRFYTTKLYELIKFKTYMSDKRYISWLYKKRFNKKINLEKPTTFNEKNNWRKLNDRKEEYTLMVDKFRFKEIIAERAGEEHAIKLLGVWKKPKQIDFDALPNKFVLKANHAGGVIVCRDKAKFDKKSAIKELKVTLKKNYYCRSREWPYKNVKRCIIAEEYIGENLIDFKNYCFNGKLKYTFVWQNISREDGRKPLAHFCGAYDIHWNRSDIEIDYPTLNIPIPKPECYEQMLNVAEKMSLGIPFVRVDCYIVNNEVYVGEMTFFPWGGFMKFKDEKWNRLLGDMQTLPLQE